VVQAHVFAFEGGLHLLLVSHARSASKRVDRGYADAVAKTTEELIADA
jgi:hypothetical protein